jgi:hypothetical protein
MKYCSENHENKRLCDFRDHRPPREKKLRETTTKAPLQNLVGSSREPAGYPAIARTIAEVK